jgi:Calponin homology (CH) domain
VNSYLSKKSMEITDLETDLRSGVKLVVFLESVAGRRIKGVDRKPGIKVQEIQNLSLSLKFIQQDLKVRLLGIGPEGLSPAGAHFGSRLCFALFSVCVLLCRGCSGCPSI